ncbi:MAG: MmgE/PrpD family protein [Desulfobacteraceae bacterium]|jgi:2-methylcitrate dehydratase PrpD|nr:MmgE/PrpD family protein [Desulfobacteraceae bacterium]
MSENDPKLETRLIDHLYDTDFADLDPAAVACCKRLTMDTLGVAFPGRLAPGIPEMASVMESWQSHRGASVLFAPFKAAPPLAAMINSTMMHALDFDDTLDASALHTFVTVLPAALAAAEASGRPIDGKTLIGALVLGVDVICRISLGIQHPLSWIRTATCGSFGAAAAAAKILGLDRDRISDALGIVYAQTAGNLQGLVEGRLVKRMQPAFAAAAGVTSAFLAQRGITGSRAFLTGDYGYYRLYEQGDLDAAAVLDGLGRHFTIVDLSIKPYPCCRMTHASIDAALAVRDRVEQIQPLDNIEVRVSTMVAEMVGKPFRIGNNPQVDAQFSIGYTVACALLHGDVFLGDFEPEAIGRETVKALAAKVHVVADPSLAPKDILTSHLRALAGSGKSVEVRIAAPLGNPLHPVSDAQCRRKFEKCIAYSGFALEDAQRQQLLDRIENLETLTDIGVLLSPLTL